MVDVESLPPVRYAALIAAVALVSSTVGGLVVGDQMSWAVGRAGANAVGVGVMVFAPACGPGVRRSPQPRPDGCRQPGCDYRQIYSLDASNSR